MESVAYLLPNVFGDLAIPLGKTVYPDEVVAQPAEEPASTKSTAKKKHTAKGR
ncbi:hypothetical protein [Paraflavitalea speifideaquila]|uniref:hypothetical protein n=1 Tax=Paraflavitalea speifideaquila TaxID=3076558 RepID=UPI0028EB5FD2|nr:hypothetical protein [Paraflavitalea speifideiaquila]